MLERYGNGRDVDHLLQQAQDHEAERNRYGEASAEVCEGCYDDPCSCLSDDCNVDPE